MAKKPNYSYVLEVRNLDTDELVASRSSSSQEILEMSLGDTKKWIENYEKENLVECFECQEMTIKEDISYPTWNNKQSEHGVCQDCLTLILSGEQQPRE